MRLGYVSRGLDFYGTPLTPQLHPRDTFARLSESFERTFELLQHSRSRYLQLVTQDQLTQVLSTQAAQLSSDIQVSSFELDGHRARQQVAEQAINAVNAALKR